MRFLPHNNIQNALLGLFLCLSVFAPLSFSIRSVATDSVSEQRTHSLSLVTTVVFADESTETPKDLGGGLSTIGVNFLEIGAVVTNIGGRLFNWVFEELVLDMSQKINDSMFGSTIDSLWKLVRDISNLVFIFAFLYIGIKTIIDPDDHALKHLLSRIIICALAINFSLFLVKFVVDFSNITSIEIYNQMTPACSLEDCEPIISDRFAQLMGISGYYNQPSPAKLTQLGNGGFWFYFLGFFMFIVAGFVFAAGAVLLMVRFVAIIFLLIVSPVLFAGLVLHETEHVTKELWHKLLSYSFFPPVYLLLLYISIKILEVLPGSMSHPTEDTLGGALVKSGVDGSAVFLNFFLVIFFLIFSLKAAEKMGIVGADMTLHAGHNIRGAAQGFVGRQLIGRPANWGLKKWEEKDAKWSSGPNKRAYNLISHGLDRSMRQVLTAGKKSSFGGHHASLDDIKHEEHEREGRQARLQEIQKIDDTLTNAIKAERDLPTINPTDSEVEKKAKREVLDKHYKAIYDKIRNSSYDQLQKVVHDIEEDEHALLGDKDEAHAKLALLARTMTQDQYGKFRDEKSENFDDEKKEVMRKMRDGYFEDTLPYDAEAASREVRIRKAKDLAKIATDMFEKDPVVASAAMKELTGEKFQAMVEAKIDIEVQQKIYTELSKRMERGEVVDESVKKYLDSSYIRNRFGTEKKKGDGEKKNEGQRVLVDDFGNLNP